MKKLQNIGLSPLHRLLLTSLVLSGCGNVETRYGGDRISIDSRPSGATVLVDGAEIGFTPLKIHPEDYFRSGFAAGNTDTEGIVVYRYLGRLVIKKNGCKPYSTEVDDRLLSHDISVELDCGIPDTTGTRDMEPSNRHREEPVPAPRSDSIELRLKRIDALRDKKLISDEEYTQLRQRILNEL